MIELIKKLCSIDAVSGDEDALREFIISEIDGYCDYRTDALGNILIYKEGKQKSVKKVMLDAHMDEVGLIITAVTSDGFLKFKTVGGIETESLMFRQVTINKNVNGVISGKPIHLIGNSECKKLPDKTSLYIDIGVNSKEEALKLVSLGDIAVINGDPIIINDKIISKALDDRIGCALLISLIKEPAEYDFYASFSVQEELGLRGARTAAFSINPESAIVLEATTASDIADTPEEKLVCKLGNGPAVSFMDKATVYDRKYYKSALNSSIKCQSKAAVTGGNDSGAIHLSREGIRTIALSVPCRYIHSCSSVADISDIENAYLLCKYMLNGICGGTIE